MVGMVLVMVHNYREMYVIVKREQVILSLQLQDIVSNLGFMLAMVVVVVPKSPELYLLVIPPLQLRH